MAKTTNQQRMRDLESTCASTAESGTLIAAMGDDEGEQLALRFPCYGSPELVAYMIEQQGLYKILIATVRRAQSTFTVEDAEDVAQQALIELMSKHNERFASPAHVKRLATCIAVRRARDLYRQKCGRRDKGDDALEQHAALGPTPLETLYGASARERVTAAIKCLPELYREITVLCDIEELNYTEVCERLGIPLGTVKSRLHTAHQQLKLILSSEDENEARLA